MIRQLAVVCALTATTAHAVEIETAIGPVDIPNSPERIVVLEVAAIDTLNALGIDIAGTPDALRVDYLDDVAANAATVGTMHEPNFEAIYGLKPDLIIVGSRAATQTEGLSELAPVINMAIGEDAISDGLARLDAYGILFGKEERAAELRAEIEAKFERTRARTETLGTALMIQTNGPKISAYGTKGRYGWFHTELGLPEAVQAVAEATHGEAVSFEFIKDADPDILIVADRLAAIGQPGDSARITLDNPLVQETKAWTNDNVIYLNSADVYIAGGGVQSMSRTLDLIYNSVSAD